MRWPMIYLFPFIFTHACKDKYAFASDILRYFHIRELVAHNVGLFKVYIQVILCHLKQPCPGFPALTVVIRMVGAVVYPINMSPLFYENLLKPSVHSIHCLFFKISPCHARLIGNYDDLKSADEGNGLPETNLSG